MLPKETKVKTKMLDQMKFLKHFNSIPPVYSGGKSKGEKMELVWWKDIIKTWLHIFVGLEAFSIFYLLLFTFVRWVNSIHRRIKGR